MCSGSLISKYIHWSKLYQQHTRRMKGFLQLMFLQVCEKLSFSRQRRKLQYSYYKTIANTNIDTIVDRRFLQPLFYEDLPLNFLPPLFKFCQPLFLVASNLNPPLFFLLSCFFSLMRGRATFDVFFYLMILWTYT